MQNRELEIVVCVERKLHQDITFTLTIHLCHSAVAQSHKAEPFTVTLIPQPSFPVRNKCIPLCAADHSRQFQFQS